MQRTPEDPERARHVGSAFALVLAASLLGGCAPQPGTPTPSPTEATSTTDAPLQEIECGSTNIYEPSAEAGLPTVEEALKRRLGWLTKAAESDRIPDPDGEGTFSLVPEVRTMEAALAAYEAGRHVLRKEFGDHEVITIQAIDADGKDTGEVVVDELPTGYFVGLVTVRAGIAESPEDCPTND